jgi:RHS repeat-associated protein
MNGRLSESRDLNGRVATYGYLPDGRLTRVIYHTGESVALEYDLEERVKRVVSSSGVTFEYTYGKISRTSCNTGSWYEIEQDISGLPVGYRDAFGRQGSWSWDTNGRVTACTFPDRSSASYSHDSSGRLTKQTTRKGGRLVLSYERGVGLRKVEIDGVELNADYDPYGMIESINSPKGSLGFAYNEYGRIEKATGTYGNTIRTDRLSLNGAAYPEFRGVPGSWSAAERFQQEAIRSYDRIGRVVEATLQSGLSATVYYRPGGEFERLEVGTNSVGISGSLGEREFTIADCSGGITAVSTDRLGNILSMQLPRGGAEERSYDRLGRLEMVTLPMGQTYGFSYDVSGRVTEAEFPKIGSMRLTYDSSGRLSTISSPWGGLRHFEFSPDGSLLSKTDARGQVVRFSYDTSGRLIGKETPSGISAYTYDTNGNLTQARNQNLTIDYAYDRDGRLVKVEYADWGKTIRYEYDEAGRLATLSGPEGSRISYVYDDLGRVTHINAASSCVFELTYDEAGRLSQRRSANGVTTRYGYDNRGRIESIIHIDSTGRTLAKRLYTYDLEGNRSEVIDEKVGRTSYLYDEQGRMTSEDNSGGWNKYVFGPRGNRVWVSRMSGSDTYGYDDYGRLVKINQTSLRYDANGNVVGRRDSNGSTRYFFDAEGNLTRVELPGGKVVEYGYGPLGRKIWRDENGVRTYMLYDGIHVFQELGEDLTAEATYAYCGMDRPVVAVSNVGRAVIFHEDILGSLVAMSDMAGNLLARYVYDAFGKVVEEVWYELDYPPRFAGRPLDAATGLYDMRTRHYDPEPGLYISPNGWTGTIDDPITMNPYAYARGNPLRYAEPFGLVAIEPRLKLDPPCSWSEEAFLSSSMADPTAVYFSGESLASTPLSTVKGVLLGTASKCFGDELVFGACDPGQWKLRDDAYIEMTANMRRAVYDALCTGGVLESEKCSRYWLDRLGLGRMISRHLPWRPEVLAGDNGYGMLSPKLTPNIDERLPVSGIPIWELEVYARAARTQKTLRLHYTGAVTQVARMAMELESMSDSSKDAARQIGKSESKIEDKREDAAEKLDDILELASEIQDTQAEAHKKIREIEEQDPQKRMERKSDLLESALEDTGDKIEEIESKLDEISEISEEAESQLPLAAERAPEVSPALELRREILSRLAILKEFEGPQGRVTRLREEVDDIDLGPKLGEDPMARAGAMTKDITRISERASAVLTETRASYDKLRVELDSLSG